MVLLPKGTEADEVEKVEEEAGEASTLSVALWKTL